MAPASLLYLKVDGRQKVSKVGRGTTGGRGTGDSWRKGRRRRGMMGEGQWEDEEGERDDGRGTVEGGGEGQLEDKEGGEG